MKREITQIRNSGKTIEQDGVKELNSLVSYKHTRKDGKKPTLKNDLLSLYHKYYTDPDTKRSSPNVSRTSSPVTSPTPSPYSSDTEQSDNEQSDSEVDYNEAGYDKYLGEVIECKDLPDGWYRKYANTRKQYYFVSKTGSTWIHPCDTEQNETDTQENCNETEYKVTRNELTEMNLKTVNQKMDSADNSPDKNTEKIEPPVIEPIKVSDNIHTVRTAKMDKIVPIQISVEVQKERMARARSYAMGNSTK